MRKKHCWKYFDFNQSYLGRGKIAPDVIVSCDKIKYMILHWQIRIGWDR